jgi:HK97 family phage prohead protease
MNHLYCPFEVKVAEADDGTISGYGSVFGNIDSHRDVVAKGAFKSTLLEAKAGTAAWPLMLLQHGVGDEVDSKMPIGIWTDIDEDDTGLAVQGKLALKTQRGAEAYELMKMKPRPALNGLSIGYRTKDFTLGSRTDKARRTLNAVDLHEVSLVTSPSNTRAVITDVKSATEIKTVREFEEMLRECGYSRGQAKAIASGGFKSCDEGEDLTPLVEMFRKANPNHDARGEFSSGGGGGGRAAGGGTHGHMIKALQERIKKYGPQPHISVALAKARRGEGPAPKSAYEADAELDKLDAAAAKRAAASGVKPYTAKPTLGPTARTVLTVAGRTAAAIALSAAMRAAANR